MNICLVTPIFSYQLEINDIDTQCRELFTAGRDAKLRMHEAQFHKITSKTINSQEKDI